MGDSERRRGFLGSAKSLSLGSSPVVGDAVAACKGPESSYPLGISGLRETLLGLLHLVHNSPVQSVRL